MIPWKQDILAFKKYFRAKYTPQDAGAKLVNREGGNSGMDKEPDEVMLDVSVGAGQKALNMGDGLDKEQKGASVFTKKRSKKGKGSRGEQLAPDVATIAKHNEQFQVHTAVTVLVLLVVIIPRPCAPLTSLSYSPHGDGSCLLGNALQR